MKLIIDEKADALYLRLEDTGIFDSEEVAPGIIVDYDKEGQMVGIEILSLSKRSKKINLKSLQFELAGAGT